MFRNHYLVHKHAYFRNKLIKRIRFIYTYSRKKYIKKGIWFINTHILVKSTQQTFMVHKHTDYRNKYTKTYMVHKHTDSRNKFTKTYMVHESIDPRNKNTHIYMVHKHTDSC